MPIVKTQSYNQLLSKVRQAIAAGRREAEAAKLKTYWLTGKLIAMHVRARGGKVGYGHNIVHRLAVDLDLNKTHLYNALEFYDAYPIFPTSGKLGWSHYKELLSVNAPLKRKQLTQRARVKDWSVRQLRQAIKKIKGNAKKKTKTKKLVARKGKPGHYRTVQRGGRWVRDLGFATYQIVRKAAKRKVAPKDLYTYKATLERVVDGDTLWVEVVLTKNLRTRQKLRLRGINAPEMRTRAGKHAKAFLADILRDKEITVKTSRSDKYDRYLADLFSGDLFVNGLLAEQGFAQLV